MNRSWSTIEIARVHQNRRMRLPPAVGEDVVVEDRYKGNVVTWNHDTHADVILVSAVELEDERYDSAGTTVLHERQNTVTPPKALIDEIGKEVEWIDPDEVIEKGKKMVYLANSNMMGSDPVSYYVLSGERFFRALDDIQDDSSSLGAELKNADPK